jgi:hypothetical protein
MTTLVPITAPELIELLDQLPDGEVIPLSWGVGGEPVAIVSTGDGLARWALCALAVLRGVDDAVGT